MTIGSLSAVSSVSSLLGSGDTVSQQASQSAILGQSGTTSSTSSDQATAISNATSLLSSQVASILPTTSSSSLYASSYSLPRDVIGASVALRAYAGTQQLTDSIVSTLA